MISKSERDLCGIVYRWSLCLFKFNLNLGDNQLNNKNN